MEQDEVLVAKSYESGLGNLCYLYTGLTSNYLNWRGKAMKCYNCDNEVKSDWEICPYCKTTLNAGERDIKASISYLNESGKLTSFYEESYAVIIGIDKYKHIESLNCSKADAHAVRDTLQEIGFPEENIVMLLDREATRQNIQDVMKVEMEQKCGVNDRLLFYFAGHGSDYTTSTGQKMGYLLPANVDPDYMQSRSISMDEVNKWSDIISAKHILYIIDSCYSGIAATRSSGIPKQRNNYIKEVSQRKVRQIITAGREDQKALEKDGHGIFTRLFLRALKGNADLHGRGFITGFDLGNYLESRVYEESRRRQQPLFRYLRGEGEFIFVFDADEFQKQDEDLLKTSFSISEQKDEVTSYSGRILNSKEEGISDVKLHIGEPISETITSGQKGNWSFTTQKDDVDIIKITPEKQGFIFFPHQLKAKKRKDNLNFKAKDLKKTINFKDKVIENLVRKRLGKLSGEIYLEKVLHITEIDINYGRGLEFTSINSLVDIQNLINLERLNLSRVSSFDNAIIDISELKHLSNLRELNLQGHSIEDISSLHNLFQLETVNLKNNKIKNLLPLVKLKNLSKLNLENNRIKDITPLKNLNKLKKLNLWNNKVEDITSLKKLTELNTLILFNNNVQSIEPLKNLNKLKELQLGKNENIKSLSNKQLDEYPEKVKEALKKIN